MNLDVSSAQTSWNYRPCEKSDEKKITLKYIPQSDLLAGQGNHSDSPTPIPQVDVCAYLPKLALLCFLV